MKVDGDKVSLMYRETHYLWDQYEIHKVSGFSCDGLSSERPLHIAVIDGVCYVPLCRENYMEMLAAIQETPRELSKCSLIQLDYQKGEI